MPIIVILMLLALIVWIVQLINLMRMSDDAFPGRFDKPLWVAILLFTFVLGATVFWFWKRDVKVYRELEAAADKLRRMRQNGQSSDKPD